MIRLNLNGGFLIGFNTATIGYDHERHWFLMLGPWTCEFLPFKMIINEGGLIPKGYGAAYVVSDRRAVVFYPRPFNFVIRWIRERWHRFRAWEYAIMPQLYSKEFAKKESERLQQISDQAELRGYQLGYRDGVRVHKKPHPLDQWEKVG